MPVLPVLTPLLLRHFQKTDIARACFGGIVKLLPLHVSGTEVPPDLAGLYREGLQFSDSLRKGLDVAQYQPQFLDNLDLREYQREGVSWLLFLARYNLSGILADDMGLGKTVQTLCAVVESHLASPLRHSLIICPGSVLRHWESEIKGHFRRAPLTVQMITSKTSVYTGQILLTSYNTVGKLDSIPPLLYLVLDEGHLLRNPKTILYTKVAGINAQRKVVLTGTPIQNGVMEIWALFNLLMPGFLGSQEEFSKQYRADLSASRSANTRLQGEFEFKNEKNALVRLERLHKQVLPFILRRLKSEVLQDLPDKVVQDYVCQMTDVQTQLLRKYQGTQHAQLEEISYLRKLSAHPCLVADVPCELEHSSKLVTLSELLRDCEIAEESGGAHKALIFSQSAKVLDLVEKLILTRLYPQTRFSRIDGKSPPLQRGQVASDFNCAAGPNLLLLTTSVGGLGLNLTAADIVIFLDHSWNPAEDAQAMDRAHRLGQKNVVNVYRLVTEGTIEETVLGLQNFKKRLAQALITEDNTSVAQFSTAALVEDLAKSSAK